MILEKVRNSGKVGYGYNFAKDEYCDMAAAGILDPTKVTRSALQNAASVAAIYLNEYAKPGKFVTLIEYAAETLSGIPSIAEWLGKELTDVASPEVGLDGWVNSYAATSSLISDLRKAGGITVRTNLDPLAEIWKDRPSIPENPVEIQPLEYAGEDATSKIQRIRKALRTYHADGILVSALDDIAWTLNLRGTDVHCNPVFVSYLLIASDKVSLFVDEAKVSAEVRAYLDAQE